MIWYGLAKPYLTDAGRASIVADAEKAFVPEVVEALPELDSEYARLQRATWTVLDKGPAAWALHQILGESFAAEDLGGLYLAAEGRIEPTEFMYWDASGARSGRPDPAQEAERNWAPRLERLTKTAQAPTEVDPIATATEAQLWAALSLPQEPAFMREMYPNADGTASEQLLNEIGADEWNRRRWLAHRIARWGWFPLYAPEETLAPDVELANSLALPTTRRISEYLQWRRASSAEEIQAACDEAPAYCENVKERYFDLKAGVPGTPTVPVSPVSIVSEKAGQAVTYVAGGFTGLRRFLVIASLGMLLSGLIRADRGES